MYEIKKNIEKLLKDDSTNFLDLKKANLIMSKLKHKDIKVFKPYLDSEKVILYSKTPKEISLFKINTKNNLTHQNIMGALFSLNIKSEMLGDINKYENNYYFYTISIIKDYLLTNFFKIKNNFITIEEIDINFLKDYKKEYKEINLIVKGTRLDNIIAILTNTSRSKVKEKFKNKEITLNYTITTNSSYLLKENDIFSIRKYGKYKYLGINKKTKKDNYSITILKYLF